MWINRGLKQISGSGERPQTTGSKIMFSLSSLDFGLWMLDLFKCSEWIPAFF